MDSTHFQGRINVRKTTIVALTVVVACVAAGCSNEFSVKDLSPASGVLGGGEAVTISGSGFDPNMGVAVYFGNSKASNVVINGTDKMTVTTPSYREAAIIDVRILTDNGKEYVLRKSFRYIKKAHMDIRDLGKRKSMREQTQ